MNALQRFIAVENVVKILKSNIEGTWELTPDRLKSKPDFVAINLNYSNGEVTRNFSVMVGKIHIATETAVEFADVLCEYDYGVDACAVFELTNEGEVIRNEWFAQIIGDIQDYVENDYMVVV